MRTSNFTLVRETEKAALYVVGFKYNENRPLVVFGPEGNQYCKTGYLVECWFPKSVIDANGVVADWFTKKVSESFGRFNPVMGDVIF